MVKKSIEVSCTELQAWIERLENLNEYGEKDPRAYFSRNNIWVDNAETLGHYMVNGAEAYIYKGYDEKDVFKLKRCGYGGIKGIVNLLKDTLNHNKVFPDTYYLLIGFSSYGKDITGATIWGAILRQEFVEGEFATNEQIRTHLRKNGFTLIQEGSEDHLLCLKNGFQVTDLKSQNAIVANNRVYIIDCCITKYQ